MNNVSIFMTIAIIAVVTFLTRSAPFLLFGNGKTPPDTILYLGKVIPPAVMAMLVIYCLKNASLFAWPFALPELLASVVVIGLYVYKRKTLPAILCGTCVYMVLVQLVFV